MAPILVFFVRSAIVQIVPIMFLDLAITIFVILKKPLKSSFENFILASTSVLYTLVLAIFILLQTESIFNQEDSHKKLGLGCCILIGIILLINISAAIFKICLTIYLFVKKLKKSKNEKPDNSLLTNPMRIIPDEEQVLSLDRKVVLKDNDDDQEEEDEQEMNVKMIDLTKKKKIDLKKINPIQTVYLKESSYEIFDLGSRQDLHQNGKKIKRFDQKKLSKDGNRIKFLENENLKISSVLENDEDD